MYRPTPTPQQMITHSEVPGHSGLFVLGFQERHVNFYSQQVRALNLVLALDLEGRLQAKSGMNHCRVAVVGGGAGGAMAAITLALCGCEVTIFEKQKKVLPDPGSTRKKKDASSPKTGATSESGTPINTYESSKPAATDETPPNDKKLRRHIHPHLMHWPYITGQGNRAGLPWMDWSAAEIDKVLDELRTGFAGAQKRIATENSGGSITEKPRTQVLKITRNAPTGAANWHASFVVDYREKLPRADGDDNWSKQDKLACDIVILATGFSGERSYPGLPFQSYWHEDLLDSFKMIQGNSAERVDVLVSGIGDGGIEDAIQLALETPTAVHDLLPFLFKSDNEMGADDKLHTSVKALKSWLADVERQAHAVDPNVQSNFLKDKWCLELDFNKTKTPFYDVLHEIRTVLQGKLKKNPINITLNSTEASFHSLRSSVVHRLILHCIQKMRNPCVEIKYRDGRLVPKDSWPDEDLYAIQTENSSTTPKTIHCKAEHLVLRHGPKLGFESIEFEPKAIGDSISELKTRNVLDQTRFPMWPIYGNPKRFTRFAKAQDVAPAYGDALADKPETYPNFEPNNEPVVRELCRKLPLHQNERDTLLEFVYVPAGVYVLGREDDPWNPPREVTLRGFWISRYPITVDEYMKFVEHAHYEWPVKFRDIDIRDRLEVQSKQEATRKSSESITTQRVTEERKTFIGETKTHPITDVSWIDAMHFCHWAGFSLPTGAQWEAACTGHLKAVTNRKDSPHNNGEFSSEYIHYRNTGRRMGTASVKTYAFARSPFGVVQPLGNIWEFCLDSWVEQPKPTEPDPIYVNDSRHREFRGGSWFDRDQPNPFHRGHNHDRNQNGRDGFRVVWVNPDGPTQMEQAHDKRFGVEEPKKTIAFPIVKTQSPENDQSKKSKYNEPEEGITYLATPALRRWRAVQKCRDTDTKNPLQYLTLDQLKKKLAKNSIVVVLGSYNINRDTEQRCLALSCDAWHLSELTGALVSIGVSGEKIRTCLADEVTTLDTNPRKLATTLLEKSKSQTIISIGSGSVNVVSECIVNDGIVPGFEQPTTSPVFGKELFFSNPSKSLGHGILVAYEETVDGHQYLRILAAGRSGYATAAAIALLTNLLRGNKEKLQQLPMRLVFNVDGGLSDGAPAEKSINEWQDFGSPKMETLNLEEVVAIPGSSTEGLLHWQPLVREALTKVQAEKPSSVTAGKSENSPQTSRSHTSQTNGSPSSTQQQPS